MIAAIYARKSTEQTGVSDEHRSVARQIAHARAYAARKGWTVAEDHVYSDDGISGAEFATRPGFVRLMASLAPRPAFQVLIVSEESRIGRESIEVSFALKRLVQAGIRVFAYLTDTERTLNSPMEKAMLALSTMVDESERERARLRVTDAMRRKALAGHVTGNRCFGYRNVDVTAPGPDGRPVRQYVRREINESEAAAVRLIFELCAMGEGLKAITKRLNADGVPAPRSQRGRPRAWPPSSVREALYRDAYRGLTVWNKTRKRDAWGQRRQADRPESEWLRVEAPHLRIVSDALWQAAHAQLAARRENYKRYAWKAPDGRGVRKHYLLSGFARCAVCGGSMQAVSRSSTRGQRSFRYTCAARWNRGATVCSNTRQVSMEVADEAVRDLIGVRVLKPDIIERAIVRAVELLKADEQGSGAIQQRKALTGRLERLDKELANLADVVAKGGAVPVILDRLAKADTERRDALLEIQQLDARAVRVPAIDMRKLTRMLRGYLADWQGLMAGNVAEARGVLSAVLGDRLTFRPLTADDGAQHYEITAEIGLDRVLAAVVPGLQVRMASPRSLSKLDTPPRVGGPLRRAA